MVLEVSAIHAPPVFDKPKIPTIDEMLADNLKKQGHLVPFDQIKRIEAPGLDLAWAEYGAVEEDPQTKLPRPAIWRQAHGHAGKFHRGPYMPFGIVTFGFWSEFVEQADVVWGHFLQSMVIGQPIADPARGPQYH